MYKQYDFKNPEWIGDDEFICNGCGTVVMGSGALDEHLKQCTISKIRIHLDKKTCGKAKFTKVR